MHVNSGWTSSESERGRSSRYQPEVTELFMCKREIEWVLRHVLSSLPTKMAPSLLNIFVVTFLFKKNLQNTTRHRTNVKLYLKYKSALLKLPSFHSPCFCTTAKIVFWYLIKLCYIIYFYILYSACIFHIRFTWIPQKFCKKNINTCSCYCWYARFLNKLLF